MKRLEQSAREHVDAREAFSLYLGLNESGCSRGASRSRSSRSARTGDSSVEGSTGSSKGEGPMVPASEAGVMMTGGAPNDERL